MSIQNVTNSISFSTNDYSNPNLILSTWRDMENISENVYYNNKENSKISYIPKTKKILKKKIIKFRFKSYSNTSTNNKIFIKNEYFY